jgi:hypothetical protein
MKNINRNIFNQYEGPENRVTHALAHAVASNRHLTQEFLHVLLRRPCPRDCVLEIQELPVQAKPDGRRSEEARGTRPDLWICSKEAEFVCVIENKLTAPLDKDQLLGHMKRAKNRGFTDITIVAITSAHLQIPPAIMEAQKQATILWHIWPELHSWLTQWANNKQSDSWLVRQFCEFLQLTEEELLKEGKMVRLTEFSGIPFSDKEPYEYLRAKSLLRALMQFLRESKTLARDYPQLDPKSGRRKITEREDLVWDFMSLESGRGVFTRYPHLTIIMRSHRISFQLTVPNASAKYWKILKHTTDNDWQRIFSQILINASKLTLSRNMNSPQPYLEVLHRHYPGQAAEPVDDGHLFFALDSVVDKNRLNPHVKVMPTWKEYLQPLIANKPQANIQLAIGVQYFYRDYHETSSILRQAEFKDEAVKALCTLKPFYDFLYGKTLST